jgi:DNA-binding transcriptional LysR family regulator
MINATWLQTFTTLCETGHFTRAAEQLGMTQPGVSQHLRKLEAQIGKPLIAQDGKRFTLTSAGEAVLAVGRARHAEERALWQAVEEDRADAGDVSIGCSGSFAMWIYPHLLDRMQTAPELVVRLTAAPQSTIVKDVLSGDLDLGIVAQDPDHPRLQASLIAQEELCLVLPANCAKDKIDLTRLNALGFVAHPDGFAYADDLFSLNFPQEYVGIDQLKIRTFVNQIGQIPVPVARGLGYTILPKSGVDAYPRPQDLAVIALPKCRRNALWIIAQQGRARFARIQSVQSLITGAARSLGTQSLDTTSQT